jgi:hypothetical protein
MTKAPCCADDDGRGFKRNWSVYSVCTYECVYSCVVFTTMGEDLNGTRVCKSMVKVHIVVNIIACAECREHK